MAGHDTTMHVDCRTCPVRDLHCGDCMVPVFLEIGASTSRDQGHLDPDERAAVTLLVRAGLVDPETAARARASVVGAAGATEEVGTAGEHVGAARHDRAVG